MAQFDEIAAMIVRDLLKARADVIAGAESSQIRQEYMKEYLSDEAVAETYKAVFASIVKATRTPIED